MGSQFAYTPQASTQVWELPEAPDLGQTGPGRARVHPGGAPCDGCVSLDHLQALLTEMLAGASADLSYAAEQRQFVASERVPSVLALEHWSKQLLLNQARVQALKAIEGELLGQVRL